MSGFAVAFGRPDVEEVNAMFERINHRGPYAGGVHGVKGAVMAQNYLKADGDFTKVLPGLPLASARDGETRICYDGQIGNCDELAASRGSKAGPFLEERLLLRMYHELGSGMLDYLGDATFSFVISDGEELFAARDLLGIKTLFYGLKGETIYLSSELKGVLAVTDEVYEFPAGHYMDGLGRLSRFAALPKAPPEEMHSDVERMLTDIRDIVQRSFNSRVDFRASTGSLLSGGIDSSVVAALASEAYKGNFGSGARLKTFALGVGESADIQSARIVSEHLDTEHHELIVGLEDMLLVLPDVIYHLENFDPSLVRSSISNFLISRFAGESGIQVLLSGEGGDEVFCGYKLFKALPPEEVFEHQMKCLGFLHSNASLRLDRMNACNSIRVVTPLISGELLDYALSIPPEHKVKPEGADKIEKWIFRKAFEHALPTSIVWRLKQEFSQGSGAAAVLPEYFENVVTDAEFEEARAKHPIIRSKEEFYYFRIFKGHFGAPLAVETVGQWVSL
jgi:asparagine synthase (glutamine-hydrolysing)